MQNKINRTSIGAVLVSILLLTATITPTVIFCADNSSSTPITVSQLAERITGRYLITLGYNSSEKPEYMGRTSVQMTWGKGTSDVMHNGIETTVNFNYILQLKSGTFEGYVYRATFQSNDGKEYNVEESAYQTTNDDITTTVNQTITGSTTYFLLITEKMTPEGSVVVTNRDINIYYQNKSGTFVFNAKANGLWNSDMSIAVSLNATIDQNMTAPFGCYKMNAFTNTNGQTKVNMTMPNGTVVDPGFYQYADEYNDFQHLTGWFFWATEAEFWAMNFGLFLVNLVFLAFPPALLIGITMAILEGLGLTGDLFMADIEGTGVVVFYVLAIEFYGAPCYAEAGYYTNQLLGDPLDNWYYIPLFRSPPFDRDIGTYYWHAGVWPILY